MIPQEQPIQYTCIVVLFPVSCNSNLIDMVWMFKVVQRVNTVCVSLQSNITCLFGALLFFPIWANVCLEIKMLRYESKGDAGFKWEGRGSCCILAKQ